MPSSGYLVSYRLKNPEACIVSYRIEKKLEGSYRIVSYRSENCCIAQLWPAPVESRQLGDKEKGYPGAESLRVQARKLNFRPFLMSMTRLKDL